MKFWGCRLWSSEHWTPDEFKYHNVLCIFKSKSSDYTIKPCAPLAFSNRRLEALFSLLPLLFCPITVFFNRDYFQKGFFSHTYTEQNKVHIKNFKAEIPRPKTLNLYFTVWIWLKSRHLVWDSTISVNPDAWQKIPWHLWPATAGWHPPKEQERLHSNTILKIAKVYVSVLWTTSSSILDISRQRDSSVLKGPKLLPVQRQI